MSVMQVDSVTNALVRGSSFLRVEGGPEIAQGCDVRLKKLRGEDPMNLDDGTRWLGLIFLKGTPESLILGELVRRLLTQPGMQTVDEIDASRLPGESLLTVVWAGTGSISSLREGLRIQGLTQITS